MPWQDHLAWLRLRDQPAAEHYWRKHLEAVTEPSQLTFPKLVDKNVGQAEQWLDIGRAESDGLADFARSNGLTQACVLQGLFALTLAKMSRLDEIIIASVRSGRSNLQPGIDTAVGLFIDTMPLRIKLHPSEQLVQWLKEQQIEQSEQDQHAHLGLTAVQAITGITGQSLFEALFIYENYPVSDTKTNQINELTLSHLEARDGTHHPAALTALPGQTLRLRLSYDRSRLDMKGAKTVLGFLSHLISSVKNNGETELALIGLVNDVEQRTLLAEARGHLMTHSNDAPSFIQRFESQAKDTPDKRALSFENSSLTYAELDRRSNQLARFLIQHGAGPESVVALGLPRSIEMVIALLGVLKSGAAYLPLDPDYPPERLRFMLEDSGAKVILTQQTGVPTLRQALQTISYKLLTIEVDHEDFTKKLNSFSTNAVNQAERRAPLLSQHLAYVLYTSGSTGTPKGVQVTHVALLNFLLSMQQTPGFQADDILLAVTTISFDIAGLELYLPLISGGTITLVSREIASDGFALLEAIQASRASVMQATPATWQMLMLTGAKQLGLKRIFCGGEALSNDLADQLALTGAEVWNLYGPTETTIWSTVTRLKSEAAPLSQQVGTVPIGTPIAHTQTYVLDAGLNLVPRGVIGELYIAGAGLARGYLGRPALTAERFVACPFAAGQLMYRTGDLVRCSDDGILEYLGRVDQQVKLRGFRIEFGEIESTLLRIEGVAQCAVQVRGAEQSKQLVAYLVYDAQQRPYEHSELKRQLADKLPDYMIPTAYVALSALPLTPNGKIDRRALLDPEVPHWTVPYRAPNNKRQEQFCKFFAEMTGAEQVGLDDDFFKLGGDSIAAMRLISRARGAGLNTTVRDVFRLRTPAELANLSRRTTDRAATIQALNDAYDPLWLLKDGDQSRAVFFIHPIGGIGTVYQKMAEVLDFGSRGALWALQARGLEANESYHQSLADMAQAYVAAIKTAQPQGPYRLIGWSFGGSVAHEMAVQLEALGDTVELLAILDTVATNQTEDNVSSDSSNDLELILRSLADRFNISCDTISLESDNFLTMICEAMANVGLVRRDTPPEGIRRMLQFTINAAPLKIQHSSRVCQASIVFVKANDKVQLSHAEKFDWRPYTSGTVTVINLPIKHLEFCDPEPSQRIAAAISNIYRYNSANCSVLIK
ncbi:MAG: hypothetical protein CK528_15940 [Alcaligenaceae bacterium]|nr:MAG: hypothetical protein CK528_15940 [Alcaligenaceae bacterium]